MRICFFAGANSMHSYRWVRYFALRGHEVYWISLHPNTVGLINGVNFRQLRAGAPKLASLLYCALRARSIIKRIKPDIVHAHYVTSYGVLALLTGFRPFVVSAWGSDVLHASTSVGRKLLVSQVLKRADLLHCDAEHMREAMVKLGANPEKIRVTFFGTDVERFHPRNRDAGLRRQLGWDAGPLIISCRNLEPVYDVETVIRCVPHVLSRVSDALFLIAGSGSQRERLQALCAEYAIERNVRFLGRLSESEMAKYLATADVYVSVSLHDGGLAATTAEAMASGTATVVTDCADNAIWIKHGRNGLLVPPGRPELLADSILELLGNDRLRSQCGEEGRRTIVERNNYWVQMAKMEALYDGLLGLRQAGGSS